MSHPTYSFIFLWKSGRMISWPIFTVGIWLPIQSGACPAEDKDIDRTCKGDLGLPKGYLSVGHRPRLWNVGFDERRTAPHRYTFEDDHWALMDSKGVAEEVELFKHGAQEPLFHSQSPATINEDIQHLRLSLTILRGRLFFIDGIWP